MAGTGERADRGVRQGPDGGFRLAAVFDRVDPVTGPGFAPDRAVVDDPEELAALVAYLRAGAAVLMTPMLMDDVLDATRRGVVPLHYRTDGEWIWTDTVTYYLERYALAPEAALRSHVRERGVFGPAPDAETVQRAADFVLNPPEPPRPVWRPDGSAPTG
ncbi:hypothetical protein J5Y04_25615 [Kitasatospora sp. RG8]|uniref:hypothetical protein n=1 Tax=Kitasatospora sp. RG8 TaxID=2820815 RepID=UPI001AE0BC54|nr:hypothetical protein [Kitasatospora sp. RG8]MBP0452896.1 hypothetical protein [Kitasatospora sp. RG8]